MYPNLAIATALRDRGHEVALYTGARAGSTVEGEGFRHFPFQRIDEARVEQLVLSPQGILSRPKAGEHKKMYREWVLDTIPDQLADLDEVMKEWTPDAIVCDPTMWAPFLVLHEERQLPVAIFSLVAACLLSGREGPVLGYPQPRPRNGFERVRFEALKVFIDFYLGDVRRSANELRGRHDLPPIRMSVTDYAGQMPLYLVPSSPEFDYERSDLPPSVHYVGPCLWSKSGSTSAPQWLATLPDDRAVYITEGTVNLEPKILKSAAIGLADLPVQVIMTTGRHRDIEMLDLGPRPLASNLHVEQFVPMDDLLPRVDVVVTTGGPSTVLATLLQGLPLVIVPSDWDHPETAWRVADAGAGIWLKPEQCTPERLRTAVLRLLEEPSFRENARRLGHTLETRGGPVRVVELLEEMIQQP
ncbi:MAG: glycosyltransferase [Chloroflexota bacterium]|nr:glycosyltransferase [Chloroflexota bacterium]